MLKNQSCCVGGGDEGTTAELVWVVAMGVVGASEVRSVGGG